MAQKAGTPPLTVLCDDNGIPITVSGGSLSVTGGGGGGASTIADGADVALGATTDAANTTGAAGTVSGKLRGLVSILSDVWDSVAHRLKVSADLTASTPVVVTGNGNALNATPIAATEAPGYFVSVHITGGANATVVWETSNDNVNWVGQHLTATGVPAYASSTTSLTNNVVYGRVCGRYFRVRISVYTSGTVTATALFSPVPSSFAVDTELPPASVPSDALANPTIPNIAGLMSLYNGATWDRARGDIANGLDVDVTRVTGTVTVDSELPAAVALSDGVGNPTTPIVGAALLGYQGGSWFRVGAGQTGDESPPASSFYANVMSQTAVYNGTSFVRQRTSTVFKTVSLSAATAETTIWTPASGKKFRLMGLILTCGAASTLTFKDNTGGTTIFVTRGGTDTPISVPNLGNGILSGAADRVLTVTRGTSATLDGVVWGTEE